MRPELPEALPLPPDNRVGLNVKQRAAPVAPNAGQTDPEQPIEGSQHRSFPLVPESCELQPERSVFDGNGLVAAQQESNESNERQKKGWHVSRFFAFIRLEVNLLRADGVMSKDRLPNGDVAGHGAWTNGLIGDWLWRRLLYSKPCDA